MPDIIPAHTRLAPSRPHTIEKVHRLTDVLRQLPQVAFVTEHLLHAGMYTRTVRLPAETAVAAVLIQVPTVLIVAGHALVYCDDEVIEVGGYCVLPGSAGRKVAFVTRTDIAMSMVFPTQAKTVHDAEKEFTPEFELLPPLSAADQHVTLITGE